MATTIGPHSDADLQPISGDRGATILGPRNIPLERENPDLLASPYTDSGTIPNLKFSFSTARNRLLTGGWAREVTTRELPVATELARRYPRNALAQGGGVGLHARGPRAYHRRRRTGTYFHR